MPNGTGLECHHTITLLPAGRFYVDDVVNAISATKFPCDHRSNAAYRPPPFFCAKWSSTPTERTSNNESCRSGARSEGEDCTQPITLPDTTLALLSPEMQADLVCRGICKSCADSIIGYKKYLVDQLYKAAVDEKKFNLWNSFGERIKQTTGTDRFMWTTMATIYQDDLVAFCKSERIRVVFENPCGQIADRNLHTKFATDSQHILPQPPANAGVSAIEEGVSGKPHARTTSETGKERVDRLAKRKAELRSQGVSNFNEELAKEEGVSVSRIKQLLGPKDRPQDRTPWPLYANKGTPPKKIRKS